MTYSQAMQKPGKCPLRACTQGDVFPAFIGRSPAARGKRRRFPLADVAWLLIKKINEMQYERASAAQENHQIFLGFLPIPTDAKPGIVYFIRRNLALSTDAKPGIAYYICRNQALSTDVKPGIAYHICRNSRMSTDTKPRIVYFIRRSLPFSTDTKPGNCGLHP